MMEQALMEYMANAAWQIPLLASGAWLLLRIARPGPAGQHRVWLAVLGLALLLPLHGTHFGTGRTDPAQGEPAADGSQARASQPDAFDSVGEPSGLVLGQRMAGSGFSWLALPVRVRQVHLNAGLTHSIVGLYLIMALFGLFRIAWAWRAARRLVGESREVILTDRGRAAFEDCSRRLGVPVPQVRASGGISGPVVVGAVKPVLLWPETLVPGEPALDMFATLSEGEVMAALCHEMAHIRRHDSLVNLLCEVAAVPLRWHPVTSGVERRIRSTREMVCDAIAAEAMESEMQYAKCLLRLAESMAAGGMAEQAVALGLFHGNVLEERVMRLMQAKTMMSTRVKVIRGVAGGATMMAAIALAAVFHVVPAMAQTPSASVVQQQVRPTPVAPVAPAPAAVAVPALPPVAKLPPLPSLPATQMGVPAPAAPLPPLPALPEQTAPAAAPRPAPMPPSPPVPAAAPVSGAKGDALHVHRYKGADGRSFVIVNGEERDLTPAERARVEKQLEEAQKKIAAATAKLNSPEFKKQMEDAQRKAQEALNNPEFQKKMADAQKQIAAATAKLNSPEFRQQLEEAQQKALRAETLLNSGELQEQMANAQKQLADALAKMKAEQRKDRAQ